MTKEEFVDFLNSYRIMLEFDDENNWFQKKIHEDVLNLSDIPLEFDNHRTPTLNVTVDCNNSYAALRIVCGNDYVSDTRILAIFIFSKEFKFKKFKHKSLDYYGGYEIFAKGDYEVIRDAFLFSISKLKDFKKSI